MQYNVGSNNYTEKDYLATVGNGHEISNRSRIYNGTNTMIMF